MPHKARRRPARPGPPPRESWHAEPAKVFDNLYFLGQTEYSVWAITTSAGVILIDSIFDYSVDDEVVGGMRKLGLDPATIKYVILSHGHSDHSGGAKYLQDTFNARVILGAADWDLLDRSSGTRPRRDMVGTDGQKLTLGDTTVTLHATPGHTLGTLSVIFPVKDHGTPHMAATWGGTAFNWMNNPAPYVTPDKPVRYWFETYSDSARRFKEITARAGVDVLVSNHTIFDGSKTKIPALERRKPVRSASLRDRQGLRAALPDGGERMRAGRPRQGPIGRNPVSIPSQVRTDHRIVVPGEAVAPSGSAARVAGAIGFGPLSTSRD